MEYLIRFAQTHDTFRQPETEALAVLTGLHFEWLFYSYHSPFAVIRFLNPEHTNEAAKTLISRSILCYAIYELWGSGNNYAGLHQDVRARSHQIWPQHHLSSFRFEMDSFQGPKHTNAELSEIVDSFSYTNFKGPIRMRGPDNQFVVFEEYDLDGSVPNRVYLGRLVSEGGRKAVLKYSLKKRSYIATTSMDAELSLVTANLALAAPGKLAYDPFMGTGSFPLACAHFGASVFGSDLDGRSIRGKKDRSVKGNFKQYDTLASYLGGFTADITNTPLRPKRLLDAIICDPPYGVREGLKVLGNAKKVLDEAVVLSNGQLAHLADTYVPPKKPYSFVRMLDDILDFGAQMLVDHGRLCMWMPVAGAVGEDEEEEQDGAKLEPSEYTIPRHPALMLVSECTQHFNKWSRRLLTYRRLSDAEVSADELLAYQASRMVVAGGAPGPQGTANDLNEFRRKYFQGFRDPLLPRQHEKLPHKY